MSDIADRLAVALCYLHCIDNAVDGFEEVTEDHAWDVISLVASAKKTLLDGMPVTSFKEDAEPIIRRARDMRLIEIRDTELYMEAMNCVRQIARKTQ